MISVIVPVYNVEDYIGECIESIIRQTYPELEIILVDDGSTDNSGIICDGYAKCDARIKVIHKENGGLSDARNAGIENAQGDWLAFVDGDDFIHKDMYRNLYTCICETGADIAACLFFHCKEYKKDWTYSKPEKIKIFSGAEALCNLSAVQVTAVNKIYQKKFFASLRYPAGKLHEDEATIHRILFQCERLAYLEEELYGYRMRDGSIMTSRITPKRICDAVEALKDRVNFVCQMNWEEPRKAVINRFGKYVRDYYFVLEKEKISGYKKLQRMLRNELRQIMREKKGDFSLEYRIFNYAPWCYQGYEILMRVSRKFAKMLHFERGGQDQRES